MVDFWVSIAVVIIPYVLGVITALSVCIAVPTNSKVAAFAGALSVLALLAFIIITNPITSI